MDSLTADEARWSMIEEYGSLFGLLSGQRILEDIRRSFGKHPSYVRGDPYQTAFNEGARSVYLRIEHLIELSRLPKDQRGPTQVMTEESI